MKKLMIPLFLIMAGAQWAIPSIMIADKEAVLKKGHAFKFLTEPVDPSNPFKGRYISLRFKETEFKAPVNHPFKAGQEVFVLIKNDPNGFAKIADVQAKTPVGSTDYIKIPINYINYEDGRTLFFSYPFDEYYMEESKAPRAENVYRESTADSTKKTYALVKIRSGDAVIENVFVDDIPIEKLIK